MLLSHPQEQKEEVLTEESSSAGHIATKYSKISSFISGRKPNYLQCLLTMTRRINSICWTITENEWFYGESID